MKDNDFSTVQLIIRDITEHEPDDNPEALHISVKALELVLTQHIEPLRDRKNSIVHLQERLTAADERADVLEGLVGEVLDAIGREPLDLDAVLRLRARMRAALKPAEGWGDEQ